MMMPLIGRFCALLMLTLASYSSFAINHTRLSFLKEDNNLIMSFHMSPSQEILATIREASETGTTIDFTTSSPTQLTIAKNNIISYASARPDKKFFSLKLKDQFSNISVLSKRPSSLKVKLDKTVYKSINNLGPSSQQEALQAIPSRKIKKAQYTTTTTNITNNFKLQRELPPKEETKIISPSTESLVKLSDSNDSVLINIPSEDTVGSAVFTRGGYLWIILTSKKNLNLSEINNSNYFIQASQLPSDTHTIVKLKHSLPNNIIVKRATNSWQVIINKKDDDKDLPHTIINQQKATDDSNDIFFPIEGASNEFRFKDPEIGDVISIISIFGKNAGVAIGRQLVDFELLPTDQGMVIIPTNEDISITTDARGVSISSPNASSLQSEGLQDVTRNELKNSIVGSTIKLSELNTVLPFTDGKEYTDERFVIDREQLQLNVTRASHDHIPEERLKLATFYFKHNMYAEAAQILELLCKTPSSAFYTNIPTLMLFAVTEIYNEHLEDARKILDRLAALNLPDNIQKEMDLWRAIADYKAGRREIYIPFLENIDSFLFTYPIEYYWDIALIALDTLTYNNKPNEAGKLISLLGKAPLRNTKYYENSLNYFKALVESQKKNYEAAMLIWDDLKQDSSDPLNRVRSELAYVKLQVQLKQIDYTIALERLNKLTVAWRGDQLEQDLLFTIADFHYLNKEYIEALRVYKYIVNAFEWQTDQFFLTRQMAGIFKTVFSPGGIAETMPDFETVSLFYEFRELMPIGYEGDQIVIGIARRLINLDLLDSAEELLTHQVSFRLTGKERILIANHLAWVQIMNKKPSAAIETIEKTDRDNYTYQEHLTRLRIKAKAYADMQEYDQAIQLIKNDDSIDANMLREEIYFRKEDWQNLIKTLEPSLIDAIKKGQTFSVKDSQDVLKLAISYAMLEMYPELEYLSKHVKSNQPGINTAIDFLKDSDEQITVSNFNSIVNIEPIEKFMQKYKKELFG